MHPLGYLFIKKWRLLFVIGDEYITKSNRREEFNLFLWLITYRGLGKRRRVLRRKVDVRKSAATEKKVRWKWEQKRRLYLPFVYDSLYGCTVQVYF